MECGLDGDCAVYVRCLSALQILNSFNISGMDEAMLFRFGKWVENGTVRPRGEKFPPKGAWSGSRDPFKNFKPPSIFLDWIKLRSSKLANKSVWQGSPQW